MVPISSVTSTTLQLKMKWFSVLALCAALFIAATHASQLQDVEGMMDRAVEETILKMLLTDQAGAGNGEEIVQANEESAAVYKGRISTARDKANVQCNCHCHWKKASKARGNARSQCHCCIWNI